MSKLYIGGYEIELTKAKIAQTKQANDLSSLNTRQANFTNRFKAPLTAQNKRAFNMLGVVGSTSLTPYIKEDAYLYSDSGECFIYKGFAVINSTTDAYNINIYDGNIDLYKAIENLNLSSLDLSEIAHDKTLTNVLNSFDDSNNLDYKYIIADYNGKALYDTTKINIDYLVPSVRVSYLWNKIFDTFGFTYSGAVFNTFDFTNLWMTYPKGILSTVPDVVLYDTDDAEFIRYNGVFDENLIYRQTTYFKQITNTQNDIQQIFDDKHFKIFEAGNYRVEITGSIKVIGYIPDPYNNINFSFPVQTDLWLGKNSEGISNSDNVVLITRLQENVTLETDFNFHSINVNSVVELEDNESLCIVLKNSGSPYRNISNVTDQGNITFTISKVDSEIVNFGDAFIDFKIKDFFNEVLFRYGLTPYKDKYSNNYTFYTLQEVLQNPNVDDWSAEYSKFSEKKSESYVYGSYAQQNVFKHKYNDNNDDYYNGNIVINNENLADSKTVITSKIYVPEKVKTNNFEKTTNVYKLWNKEPKDDGTVNYKSLSKRFYFMRYEDFYFSASETIGSEQLQTDTTINYAPFESFFGLSFVDSIQNYYTPLYQILNNSKVIKADIFLNDSDVTNLDFTKLKYIKELGGYFLLNKISNYIGKGATSTELISVDYTFTPVVNNSDTIIGIGELRPSPPNARFFIFYKTENFTDTNIEYVLNGGAPVSVPNNGSINIEVPINSPEIVYSVYLQDSEFTSETKTFTA